METTIALSPDLAHLLERYREQQEDAPSLDALVEDAVRAYLEARTDASEFRPFYIRPAERGSGFSDISINHDKYLTER